MEKGILGDTTRGLYSVFIMITVVLVVVILLMIYKIL